MHPIYVKIEDFQLSSILPGMAEFALHKADSWDRGNWWREGCMGKKGRGSPKSRKYYCVLLHKWHAYKEHWKNFLTYFIHFKIHSYTSSFPSTWEGLVKGRLEVCSVSLDVAQCTFVYYYMDLLVKGLLKLLVIQR